MKILLAVMIVLSLFVGLPINGEWYMLYIYEFQANAAMFKRGTLSHSNTALWILLLLLHITVIALPFLTKSKYFKKLLFWIPPLFVLVYILPVPLYLIWLIPFILTWVISLIMYQNGERKQRARN